MPGATVALMSRQKALVADALGVTGRTLVNHLVSLGDWDVIGLSRRSPEFSTPATFISLDLLKRAEVESKLKGLDDVTHLFYAALQPAATFAAEVAPNLAMLANTVETVARTSRRLRKVVLIEGAKYYGAHLGPYKTPAKETDLRHMPPNYYYDQEDYLRQRAQESPWSWTALRPSCICGFAVGNPMNMATVIAVYAALCKELGLAPRFPGSAAAYHALMEMTDSTLLAKAIVWAGQNEACDGEAFNITNGDFNRWEHLWPRLADFFNLPCGSPPAAAAHPDDGRQRAGLGPYGQAAWLAGLRLPASGGLAVWRSHLQPGVRRHVRHHQGTPVRFLRMGGHRRNVASVVHAIPDGTFHSLLGSASTDGGSDWPIRVWLISCHCLTATPF